MPNLNYKSKEIIELVEVKELEKFTSYLPSNYVIPNTKLANEIVKDLINKVDEKINVAPKQKKKEVIIYASLSCEDSNVQLPVNYTPFDREVLNAVCSLYDAGNEFIWPAQIYRTMAGLNNTEYISPQCIELVCKSLDKQMYSKLKIDFTEQIPMCKIKVENAIFESNMLNMKKCKCVVNGAEIVGYKLLAKPMLYDYSQKVGQVISVNIEHLNTKGVMKNSPENIVIKHYLIRRIEILRNDKSSYPNLKKIKKETFLEDCKFDTKYKTQIQRYRTRIKKLLDFWISVGYIKGYTEVKKGNAINTIDIIV